RPAGRTSSAPLSLHRRYANTASPLSSSPLSLHRRYAVSEAMPEALHRVFLPEHNRSDRRLLSLNL
ncbi:MAG TPA: hypothetical protein VK203_24485, partial [Nostocaceae cyanobacterium]|nr:hypothetical protein [Nostocaceae cyanobacterium]